MAEQFLFEMHFHTSETSPCGNIPAAQGVAMLAARGYAGAVVTDHYHSGFFDRPWPDWRAACDAWLAGYRAARAAAPEGFRVLLGAELRFPGSPNDYLVYGLEEALLYANPRLDRMTPERFRAFADAHGLYFAQAHPFRDPGPNECTPEEPRLLDAVEVYNGNLRHRNCDALAEAFARENGLPGLSGSDFHELEDVARGGVYFPALPRDEQDLIRLLRAGGFTLRRT